MATYRAYFERSTEEIYRNRPKGNLIGDLPLGARPHPEDSGSLGRSDGGDPFEHARFLLPGSNRVIVVTRELK